MANVYNPNNLSVVFGGRVISGFAVDDALTIEREHPHYKTNFDLHGNPTRTKVNNDSTKITVTLTHKSPSNNVLGNFLELDRLNGGGVFPISIKEPDGASFFVCTHAYITDSPKIGYAGEEKTKTWSIQAYGVTQCIGN